MLQKTTETQTKLSYSVEELAEATSLSKAYLRNEIRDGKLKAKRVGRRVLILIKDIDAYFSQAGDVDKEKKEKGEAGSNRPTNAFGQ